MNREEATRWWRDIATTTGNDHIDGLICDGRRTRIVHRRPIIDPNVRRVLVVSDVDRQEHTNDAEAARWIIAHASAMDDSLPSRRHRHIGHLAAVFAAAAALATCVAVGVNTNIAHLGGTITGLLFASAALWLHREHHTQRRDRLISADQTATEATGVNAAAAALATNTLYRTWLHQRWEQRNPISKQNRLARVTENARPAANAGGT